MMKKEGKMKKMDSDVKSSTISKVYRCYCNFFLRNLPRCPCFSECVSFPKKINNQFGVSQFFPKKSDNCHWT